MWRMLNCQPRFHFRPQVSDQLVRPRLDTTLRLSPAVLRQANKRLATHDKWTASQVHAHLYVYVPTAVLSTLDSPNRGLITLPTPARPRRQTHFPLGGNLRFDRHISVAFHLGMVTCPNLHRLTRHCECCASRKHTFSTASFCAPKGKLRPKQEHRIG